MFCRAEPAVLKPIILENQNHISGLFTAGLIADKGEITETSGQEGSSYVVRYSSKDNRILQKMDLPSTYTARGITEVGNKLYLLTLKQHKLFILRSYSFEFVESLNFSGEGWGIAYDGMSFITSDGGSRLQFRDSKSFEVHRSLGVYEGAKNWRKLSELEFAQGLIWATVEQSPIILAVDPTTGEVVGKADLSDLVQENQLADGEATPSGIAYDKEANGFWITGPHWQSRYLIRFIWYKPLPPAPQAKATSAPKGSTVTNGKPSTPVKDTSSN